MSTIERFKQWADAEFGPATGDIPQHERFASYFKAWSAGRDEGLREAISHIPYPALKRLAKVKYSSFQSTGHGKWEGMYMAYEQAALKCVKAANAITALKGKE